MKNDFFWQNLQTTNLIIKTYEKIIQYTGHCCCQL